MADLPLMSADAAIPQQIASIAWERGVTPYVPAVLAMTRRLYPGRSIDYWITTDPEDSLDENPYIVFEVDITGLDAGQLAETQRHWCQEIFQHCPAPLVCVFRLGWKVR